MMGFTVNFGNIALLASLLLAIFVLVSSVLRERGMASWSRYSSPLIRLITGLLLVDLIYLIYLFIDSDFTFLYVWSYSSQNLPLIYKFSGVWAGQEGTFFLWAVLIFIAILWMNERLDLKEPLANRGLIVTSMVGIFFLIMTLLVSPFRSIYQEYPDIPADFIPQDGNGLNPLLQDPWMAAHPPVIFIGYAAVTIPFAAALAYLWKRDNLKWVEMSRDWIRFSWLFLTLGIALGGFWSYKVLGWGGFWAWDPVETSSLIPWFTVSALAHAAIRYTRSREFPLFTLSLAVISFWLVTYATFITRSGMWESVHSFGKTTTGPFLAMILVNIVLVPLILGIDYVVRNQREASREAKALVVSFVFSQLAVALAKVIIFNNRSLPGLGDILAIFGLTALLFLLLRKKFPSIEEEEKEEEEREEWKLFTAGNLYYSAILLFVILAFVSFWGLTYPFILQALAEQKLKVEVAFFNKWIFPFVTLLLVTMGMCMGYGLVRRNELLIGVMGAALLGGIAYFRDITPNPMANFLLPFVGFAFVLSFYRIFRTGRGPARGKIKLRQVSTYLIHVGVSLILLGSMVSTTMDMQRDVNFRANPSQGVIKEVKEVGRGYAVSVDKVGVDQTAEGYREGKVLAKVYKDGEYIGEGVAKVENNEKFGKVTRVYINRNWDHDVYVIFQGISGAHQQGGDIFIPLTVKLKPLINILWLGVFLLSVGILPLLLGGLRERVEKKDEREVKEKEGEG